MSNTEPHPREHLCSSAHPVPEVLTARAVPLGGPRAMTVHRTLPQRARSLIGPWCFVDHFGPDDVTATGGMHVPRHPHTGLATVTLLFAGEIEHRDSSGFANTVRPAEVNLMSAGSGISHSEFSSPAERILHGVQLWYALPDAQRFGTPRSQHYAPDPVWVDGAEVITYLGTLAGSTSPVETGPEAVAAQVRIDTGAEVVLAIDEDFEHGLLVDAGGLSVSAGFSDTDVEVAVRELAYLPAGADRLTLRATGDEPARIILIGGRPFGEEIVMWWNFVARSHDEIVALRAAWQAEIGAEEAAPEAAPGDPDFGPFPADTPAALPAPRLPGARLRPRS